MKKLIISFFVCIPLLYFGCQSGTINYCPMSTYTTAYPKHAINLQRILSDTLRIEIKVNVVACTRDSCDSNNLEPYFDTLNLKITYNRDKKTNTIINIEKNDTLFDGYVSQYRGYYYMSARLDDTSYWIGVMDYTFDSIQGLLDIGSVMCDMEDYIIHHPNCEMIKNFDTANHVIRLIPDKKILRDIYPAILEKYPKFKIISRELSNEQQMELAQIDEDAVKKMPHDYKISKNEIIESCYPNPAADFVQLSFQKESDLLIQLVDFHGKIVISKDVSTMNLDFDVSKVKPGIYILQVYSKKDKTVDFQKMVVR
jgi:hypothetical protein